MFRLWFGNPQLTPQLGFLIYSSYTHVCGAPFHLPALVCSRATWDLMCVCCMLSLYFRTGCSSFRFAILYHQHHMPFFIVHLDVGVSCGDTRADSRVLYVLLPTPPQLRFSMYLVSGVCRLAWQACVIRSSREYGNLRSTSVTLCARPRRRPVSSCPSMKLSKTRRCVKPYTPTLDRDMV